MKKVIRLTESDLARIVRRVIEEQTSESDVELAKLAKLAKGKKTGCYTVDKGDTGLAIAKKFGISPKDRFSFHFSSPKDLSDCALLTVNGKYLATKEVSMMSLTILGTVSTSVKCVSITSSSCTVSTILDLKSFRASSILFIATFTTSAQPPLTW